MSTDNWRRARQIFSCLSLCILGTTLQVSSWFRRLAAGPDSMATCLTRHRKRKDGWSPRPTPTSELDCRHCWIKQEANVNEKGAPRSGDCFGTKAELDPTEKNTKLRATTSCPTGSPNRLLGPAEQTFYQSSRAALRRLTGWSRNSVVALLRFAAACPNVCSSLGAAAGFGVPVRFPTGLPWREERYLG